MEVNGTCEVCGGLNPVSRRRPRKYCSDQCAQSAKRIRRGTNVGSYPSPRDPIQCRKCEEWFRPWRKEQKYCSRQCAHADRDPSSDAPYCVVAFVDCGHCGQLFTARSKSRKYCSVECRSDASSVRSGAVSGKKRIQCKACGLAFDTPRTKGRPPSYCSATCRPSGDGYVHDVSQSRCLNCGTKYQASRFGSRFCSDACGAEYTAPSVYVAKAPLSSKHVPQGVIYTHKCVVCSTEFSSIWPQQRCCSDACKHERSRSAWAIRRARQLGVGSEKVYPADVLERDSWTCQICGKPTPKRKRGSVEHDAPEVDHVHPVSKGGMHVRANLQCACRECNRAKGDALEYTPQKVHSF